MLIGARLVQGLGGALMAPSALSMLTVVFAEGRERNRALGVWAAISAGGAAIGLIVGGVLTEYASWRWVLFVNVPVAALAVLGALRVLPESRDDRARGFDVPGALLVTGGLIALVYALVKGNDFGWGSARTHRLMLGLAVVLLIAFVIVAAPGARPARRLPAVPFPQPARRRPRGAVRRGRPVRRLLLPRPLDAAGARLLAVAGGLRLPADDRLHRGGCRPSPRS